MSRIHIFISSVQAEFQQERLLLFEYLTTDFLFGRHFDVFLFENLPASDQSARSVYLEEVERCHIYLGLFGREYGYEDQEGLSPTEREFNHAGLHHKTRLIFLTNHKKEERDTKEVDLIKKADGMIVRKCFGTFSELKAAVYESLIRYLEEKELIRTTPFDATVHPVARMDDLEMEKIREFVTIARRKRNFPLSEDSSPELILTHLNQITGERIHNSAILLFGKQPQRFFINSEVRCAHFHGTEVTKPIPSYQVYKGDVFQLINQSVDFVLSKVNAAVGTRNISASVEVSYEIPPAAVTEAIVNAVAHRDYTSNASIQVMLFADRLEVWNPGTLPFGLTVEMLRKPHYSIPANPLLAEPMYLNGYIERMGTGTVDIIQLCKNAGLKPPDFIQNEFFKTVVWRLSSNEGEPTGELTGEPTGEPTGEVKRLVLVIHGKQKRSEIQKILQLNHQEYFRDNYLLPALEMGYIEMTFPETPNHPNQQYQLTENGKRLQAIIRKHNSK